MLNRRLAAILLAAMAFVVAAFYLNRPVSFAHPENGALKEFYLRSDGTKVEVEISPNRVGFLPRPGADVNRLTKILAGFNLKRATEESTELLIFSVPEAQSREKLVRLWREVLARHKDLIAQAGFVVRRAPRPEPFLATDEFIVKLRSDSASAKLNELNLKAKAEIVMRSPFTKDAFLVRLSAASELDCFQAARLYRASPEVLYAFPNFIGVSRDQQTLPNDTFFNRQWSHHNTGQSSGTQDADADTAKAWNITPGAPTTIVAIVENGGFDITHPDLVPNFWTNPGEVAGNNADDDANGFKDDINGWNFEPCTATPGPGCGNNNLSPQGTESHGTAVAGIAAALGGNDQGISGACPKCRLMLLRTGKTSDWAKSLAVGYAQSKGAQVVNNSWSATFPVPYTLAAVNAAATLGRGGLGTVIVFASGNTVLDACQPGINDLVASPDAIAISSSSNKDKKVNLSSLGSCIDVLAPSDRGDAAPFAGTLNITTTDRTGNAGYNKKDPLPGYCPSLQPLNKAYTHCFTGTSAAAPLVAGIAALVLTAGPSLTRIEVERLLKDTADRIEPGNGAYAEINGQSAPPTGLPTHAFGRVNAFEAVRVAALASQGGKAGVDIFVRDNRLDWGNTEQPSNTVFESPRGSIPPGESVDIKVDAPPFAAAAATTAGFESFTHENAVAGVLNKVYVRLRNRGPLPASSVTVKLHWAFAGSAVPALPADFWNAFPADSVNTAIWHPLNVQTVSTMPYSGSSTAGAPGDAAQILSFDFTAPALNPAQPNPEKHCLFAVIDAAQDRALPKSRPTIPADFILNSFTPIDNNATHRNIRIVNASP